MKDSNILNLIKNFFFFGKKKLFIFRALAKFVYRQATYELTIQKLTAMLYTIYIHKEKFLDLNKSGEQEVRKLYFFIIF